MSDRKAFQFCTFLGEGVATKSLKENHWQNMSIKENPFCTKNELGELMERKKKQNRASQVLQWLHLSI